MKLLNKCWPVILIFLIWLIFSSPYLIKHQVPFPSTYLVNFFSPWNAYPGFSSPVKNNAMPDVITQIVPWKNLVIDNFKHGQIPLWNPYSFSGMPFLANYQSAALSPFNLLFMLLPFIDAWSLLILLQPLLAGVFMLMFLKSLKITDKASVFGAVSFMFCGFITTWMAYGTLGYAILFLPLALFSIEKFYESNKNRYLILYSFVFPLSFFSGHFQISLYFFLFVLAYLIFKFYQTRNISNALHMVAYTAFGVFLSLPQILPSFELYSQSLRSGIFQKTEVIPWGYVATFFAPDFFGNPVTRNDWFGHYAEWNAYIGLFPLILCLYVVFNKKNKYILFFMLSAVFAILLSFQTPLLDFLINTKIPVLSTSAASRIIVIFSFSASVLGAFGYDKLREDIEKNKTRKIFYWLVGLLLIFLTLWLVVLSKNIIPVDKLIIAKQNLILPTILFILSGTLVAIALFVKRNVKSINFLEIIFFILLLLTVFDLLRFANKWMPFDKGSLMYPSTKIEKELMKLSGFERIFGNFGGEATTFYKLSSIEGYDALYIKRYGEFIASLENGKLTQSARSVVLFPKHGLYSKQALDLLGTKYVIHKLADGRKSWVFPFWTARQGTYNLIYDDGVYQILKNDNAFPRAFMVGQYVVEKDPQKILDTMFNPDFDLRNKVVLEKDPKLSLNDVAGEAKIINYSSNKVVISTNSKGNALLFLSDTFYPGWEALVDGKNTTIYRADYTFRAVYVPKGEHKVEFIYNPLSFNLGLLGAFLGVIFSLGISFVIKKRGKLF